MGEPPKRNKTPTREKGPEGRERAEEKPGTLGRD